MIIYVPSAHGEHSSAPLPAKRPGAHWTHALLPTAPFAVPAGQASHTGAEGVDAAAHLVAVEELATIDHHRRRILRVARVYVHVAPATEHDGVNFCTTQGARRRHGTRSRAPAFVAPRWHRQRVVAARWHVAIVSCALTQAIAGGIVVRLASNQDRQVRAVGTRTGDSPLGKFVDAWAVHRRRRRRRW
eukprot:scaffold80428_cov75-Phaeocystis_antarctica.AAC.4